MAKVNKITGRVAKKPKVRSRARTGVAAAPIDKGWMQLQTYFHQELDKKDLSSLSKGYVKSHFNKKDAAAILSNPEYCFYTYTHHCATIHALACNMEITERYESYVNGLTKYYAGLLEKGKVILKEKKEKEKDQKKFVILTPAQKLFNKTYSTIMYDLDDLEDSWMEGENKELNVYERFKFHGLSTSSIEFPKNTIEGWLLDYGDAYHKRCDQAVEGYSHLERKELKRRIKCCEEMLADLDKVRSAKKATVKIRKPKVRTADKQVAKVKYCKDSPEFKLASMPPIQMIGAMRLYVFNVKYKVLTEYVCASATGFEVRGTTITNFDKDLSRATSLRKPDIFLPIVQKKTPKQIGVEWNSLTTKTRIPNGRLNGESVLLRVFDK